MEKENESNIPCHGRPNRATNLLLLPDEAERRPQDVHISRLGRVHRRGSRTANLEQETGAGILFDKRDVLSLVTIDAAERVPEFKNMVDKDAVSLPVRSPKLFS